MANQIKWQINGLECYPEVNGNKNVVFMIRWECLAFDEKYNLSANGTQTLSLNEQTSYIAYENLTEAIVMSWLKTALGQDSVNAIEQSVTERLEKQKTPAIVSLELPWAKPAALEV